MRHARSELRKQCIDIRKVDPAVPVEVKEADRFVLTNPLHLAEVERDISEVNAAIAVRVFVNTVAVGIGRGIRHTRQNLAVFPFPRGKLLDAVVPVFTDIDIP